MMGNFASVAQVSACKSPRLASLTLLLAFAAAAAAQQAPAGQKVIHDPAEYNAYTAAVNTQDANKRAEELEAFVQQYPQSVVLTDALEQELAAWQTAGDSSQMKRVAKRLLAADPGNVRVLGIVVALDRVSAAQGDLASLNEMCVEATGGMREVPMWRKPASMTDADFAALSKLMNDIFIGAEGFCAVQEKNYSEARDWFARALRSTQATCRTCMSLRLRTWKQRRLTPTASGTAPGRFISPRARPFRRMRAPWRTTARRNTNSSTAPTTVGMR